MIEPFCSDRGIRYLMHFTRIGNLESILANGLHSRSSLEAHNIPGPFCFNDSERYDRQRDSISLSISFPNYKMFYPLHSACHEQWVVLSISSEVLWTFECAFCMENAASRNVTRIPIEERKHYTAFKGLFEDYPDKRRTDLHIPASYPTHPQAEVLAFGVIPAAMITHVYFYNKVARCQWQQKLLPSNPGVELVEGGRYFAARCDYQCWQQGHNPADLEVPVIDRDDDIPF